tara:strand:- start:9 stop:239 length:231 start_codon:yes stop_codon:yes gene_type:complete
MSDNIEYTVEETLNGLPRKIHFQDTANTDVEGTFIIPTVEEYNNRETDYDFCCEDETIDEDEIIDNYFNNLKNQKV